MAVFRVEDETGVRLLAISDEYLKKLDEKYKAGTVKIDKQEKPLEVDTNIEAFVVSGNDTPVGGEPAQTSEEPVVETTQVPEKPVVDTTQTSEEPVVETAQTPEEPVAETVQVTEKPKVDHIPTGNIFDDPTTVIEEVSSAPDKVSEEPVAETVQTPEEGIVSSESEKDSEEQVIQEEPVVETSFSNEKQTIKTPSEGYVEDFHLLYVVKEETSLYSLAGTFGISIEDLAKHNDDIDLSYNFKPGEYVWIPRTTKLSLPEKMLFKAITEKFLNLEPEKKTDSYDALNGIGELEEKQNSR